MFGLFANIQAVLPAMRNAGKGRIIIIGPSGGGVSQGTKYALCSMNETMRAELKSFGIDLTMLQPEVRSTIWKCLVFSSH